jgi:hypothetical protein
MSPPALPDEPGVRPSDGRRIARRPDLRSPPLEPVDDGIWSIVYYRTLLGRIDERTGDITGAMV